MRNRNGFTPKELAFDITLTWIKAAVNEHTDNFSATDTPSFKKETIEQLKKLHNRLLNQSGLDGAPL